MTTPATSQRALLVAYLKPQRIRVALLSTALLASITLQLFIPQLLRTFIDTARSTAPLATLTHIALLLLGVIIVNQLLAPIVTYLSELVGWTATNQLREDLTLHCLRLDLPFHAARTPGELIERVDGDVTALAQFFSQFVVRLFGNALLLLGALLLLFAENWRIGLAFALFVAVSAVVLRRLTNVSVPFFKAHRQAAADLSAFWEERVGGAEDLRANGALPHTLDRQRRLHDQLAQRATRSIVMGRVLQSAWEILLAVGNALAFALGAYLLSRGALTIGVIYLVFAYTEVVARNLFAIAQQLDDVQRARASTERIAELFARPSALADGTETLPVGALAVSFNHVTFAYAEATPAPTEDDQPARFALADLSFQLAPGEVLGLLGRTGSGKTTLVRLLARFADPTAGAICLATHDLRALQLADLRRRVGFVTQDVQLFHGSVRDNLTLWDDQISDDVILAALADLGLSHWLARWPEGLTTLLGAGGSGLSAGEAQLLALTRVFLRDPGLVILDEASAHLDPATERMLDVALTQLLQGRTAIIIAHRLPSVQRADTIMIVDAGRIVEHGARADLAAQATTRFAQLLRHGSGEVVS